MRAIEAVIYDYDGLIVDTEDVWFRACQKVCGSYGVQVGEEHRLDLMRSRLSEYLVDRFALPTSGEELRVVLYGEVDDMMKDGIPVLPGAKQSIDRLGAVYPLAIGSGSRLHRIESGLRRIGLRNRFKVLVGGDQVTHGKPAPDIYLKAAADLGVDPEACAVFEDQPKGIQAAKAAGMRCIAVPNQMLRGVDYSHADLVIPHLGKVSVGMIQDLAS